MLSEGSWRKVMFRATRRPDWSLGTQSILLSSRAVWISPSHCSLSGCWLEIMGEGLWLDATPEITPCNVGCQVLWRDTTLFFAAESFVSRAVS